ncbi:hypothetical protein L2D00_08730 [Hyphomonadaceae bacterium BL14]|nr:hypothetical protein L2D00_08730 [Hyphomonadaceae bacterium BL14]
MRWFMSILAVLVLVEAGARFCPGMLDGTAHAHAGDMIAAADCHGASAQTPDLDAEAHCTGGAACGTCVLLAALDSAPGAGPASPEADPGHAFVPAQAPSVLRLTDPPPPKR